MHHKMVAKARYELIKKSCIIWIWETATLVT